MVCQLFPRFYISCASEDLVLFHSESIYIVFIHFIIFPYYTMSAENQAAAKQTFDFQAMARRYNASRSDDKTAPAGLNSATAESLYHTTLCHTNKFVKLQ